MPAKSSKENCSFKAGRNFVVEMAEIIQRLSSVGTSKVSESKINTLWIIFDKGAIELLLPLQFTFIVLFLSFMLSKSSCIWERAKKDYYLGCLISYGILAFCISLVNTVIHRLIDPIYPAQTVINMMDVCQWTENGMIVAGLQQCSFCCSLWFFFICYCPCRRIGMGG